MVKSLHFLIYDGNTFHKIRRITLLYSFQKGPVCGIYHSVFDWIDTLCEAHLSDNHTAHFPIRWRSWNTIFITADQSTHSTYKTTTIDTTNTIYLRSTVSTFIITTTEVSDDPYYSSSDNSTHTSTVSQSYIATH